MSWCIYKHTSPTGKCYIGQTKQTPDRRWRNGLGYTRDNCDTHFARAIKPLGFKKKGTKWTRILDNGRALTFDAQKSAFSDQYYFNVTVHDVSNLYVTHSYERVVMYGRDIYNWQLMTAEQIDNLIQYTLKNYIEPKIN
jgi:hypothetical protein